MMVKPMDEHHAPTRDEVRLDLRGLKCPLPALKTRVGLARLAPGALLVVEATDPMAAIDIPHLVAETGNLLVQTKSDGAVLTFHIRKAAADPPAPNPLARDPFNQGDRRVGEN